MKPPWVTTPRASQGQDSRAGGGNQGRAANAQVRPTALKRRVEETEALQDKIDRYEKILGRSLQHLRDKAKETEGEANLAALAALGGQ